MVMETFWAVLGIAATIGVGWWFSQRRGKRGRVAKLEAEEKLRQRNQVRAAERAEEERRRAAEQLAADVLHDFDLLRRAIVKELQTGPLRVIQFGYARQAGAIPPNHWNLYWLADGELVLKATRSAGSGSYSATWSWERRTVPHPQDQQPPDTNRAKQMLVDDFRFERLLAAEHFPDDPLRLRS